MEGVLDKKARIKLVEINNTLTDILREEVLKEKKSK